MWWIWVKEHAVWLLSIVGGGTLIAFLRDPRAWWRRTGDKEQTEGIKTRAGKLQLIRQTMQKMHDEIVQLQDQMIQLRNEFHEVRVENGDLKAENVSLRLENEDLRQDNLRLRQQIDEIGEL